MEKNLWYAVQRDREDDWGTGSYDLEQAKQMARKQLDDYPDTLIAVIENDVCIEEIRDFEEEMEMKLFEGYTSEGRKAEIVLEDGRIWVVDTETGERDQYNDEWYSEDDTSALMQIKASMISDGFRVC